MIKVEVFYQDEWWTGHIRQITFNYWSEKYEYDIFIDYFKVNKTFLIDNIRVVKDNKHLRGKHFWSY